MLSEDARALGGNVRQGSGAYYRHLLASERTIERDGNGNYRARWNEGSRDEDFAHAEVYCLLADLLDLGGMVMLPMAFAFDSAGRSSGRSDAGIHPYAVRESPHCELPLAAQIHRRFTNISPTFSRDASFQSEGPGFESLRAHHHASY